MLYRKVLKLAKAISKYGIKQSVDIYLARKKEQQFMLEQVRNYHLVPEDILEQQRKEQFEYSPCISILTPLYNTPLEFLEPLLESVKNQTYANWQLCLADGSDDEHPEVRVLCEKYSEKDARIVYKKLLNNEGIVGNTNKCIEMADGEYIGLLDHDDLLHSSALFEVVKQIQNNADFIYTDEMKFSDFIENSVDIVCKNSFGKDELRSHNYICHFVVFKKSLLDGMEELYRKECEGSQDYDMVLRLTEKAEKVVHIPRILYYWRVHQGSVSMDLSVKQYAVDAAKKAIAGQLERLNLSGNVECNFPYQTIYKINYEIENEPLVSICLWGNSQESDSDKIIKQIKEKTNYSNIEVLWTEQSDEKLAKVFNQMVMNARGEYIVFLNEHCVLMSETWLEELLMYAQRKDVGVVGSHILYKDNRTYFGGGVLDGDDSSKIHVVDYGLAENDQGYEANIKHVRNTTFLSKLCMMFSKEKYESLGGFDESVEDYLEIDFCLKMHKNDLSNVWTCFSKVYYGEEKDIYAWWKTSGNFEQKWEKELEERDGFYHPLLKTLKKM